MSIFKRIQKAARRTRRKAKLKTDPTRFGKGKASATSVNQRTGGGGAIPATSAAFVEKLETREAMGAKSISVGGKKLPKPVLYVIGVIAVIGGFFLFGKKKKRR